MAKRKNREVVVRKNYTADSKRKVNKVVKANRKYKDTVFRILFSDRKNLLSLYNAVNGSNYEDSDVLEIVTLENTRNLQTINLYILQHCRKSLLRSSLYFIMEQKEMRITGLTIFRNLTKIRQVGQTWN